MLAPRTSTTTATTWAPLSMAEPDVGAPIDANGNLTSDGARTFEWDARNQLVTVNVGTHRSEFTYDGQQRRVRVVEKENGATQTDTKVLWCDKQICEERAADGTTVTRRAFAQGEQVGASARFFAADHLGSVTVVSDGSATPLGRYAFDPWGRRTVIGGTDVTSVGFTGHPWHGAAGALTLYRAYEPEFGRWLSNDPIGFRGGPNSYAYVSNDPVNLVDPLGLQQSWCKVRCIRFQSLIPMYFCDGGFSQGCSCPGGLGVFILTNPASYFMNDINCNEFYCNA